VDPAVYEKEEHKWELDGRDARFPKTVSVPEGAIPCRPDAASPPARVRFPCFRGGSSPKNQICCWHAQVARVSPSQTTQASCGTRCLSQAMAGGVNMNLKCYDTRTFANG
jgi:hypothetical protein